MPDKEGNAIWFYMYGLVYKEEPEMEKQKWKISKMFIRWSLAWVLTIAQALQGDAR